MIIEREVVEPFAENAWLVADEASRQAVLIDPGGNVPQLLERARAADLQIQAIWLTHAHLDHVSGVAEAVELTGVEVWLHAADRPLYDATQQQGEMFGLTVRLPPPPDHELVPGEPLRLGGLDVDVIHVPGHSPGHVAFWVPTAGTVISGDCLFAGSIGRTDLPGGSYAELMRSIRERLLPLGDDTRVVTGHGPNTTIGRERLTNPFLVGP